MKLSADILQKGQEIEDFELNGNVKHTHIQIPITALTAVPTKDNIKSLVSEWFAINNKYPAGNEVYSWGVYEEVTGEPTFEGLIISPAQNLNALTTDRNSIATYTDANGLIQTVQANALRIDHSTGSAKILVEEEDSNLIAHSENFSQWFSVNVTSINPTTSPDGTASGSQLVLSTTGYPQIRYEIAVQENTEYIFSFYAKKGSLATPKLAIKKTSDNQTVPYNGSTAYSVSYSSLINTTTWTKVSGVVSIPVGCTSVRVFPILQDPGGGDIELWGAEFKLKEGSYIPTDGSIVTRLADIVTTTPPEGTNEIVETIDDVANSVTTIPATYQLPVGNINQIEFK